MTAWSERFFEAKGRDGLIRRGIVSTGSSAPTTFIVLAPAGLKYHVGSHRLYVELARHLAMQGYGVLRFDPLGLGESDGQIAAAPIREIWATVEQGRFVDDLLLVCQALRDQAGAKKIIAGGLCGGAITAQLAAAKNPKLIQGLIALGTPITISAPDEASAPAINPAIARQNMRSYMQKVFSPHAWSRLLRGESDFSSIRRTVSSSLRRFWPNETSPQQQFPDEHKLFLESFMAVQHAHIKHLMIFGSNDNRWLEFEEGVLKTWLKNDYQHANYLIEVIRDANHELYWPEWWQNAFAHIDDWLHQHFPACEHHTHELRGVA